MGRRGFKSRSGQNFFQTFIQLKYDYLGCALSGFLSLYIYILLLLLVFQVLLSVDYTLNFTRLFSEWEPYGIRIESLSANHANQLQPFLRCLTSKKEVCPTTKFDSKLLTDKNSKASLKKTLGLRPQGIFIFHFFHQNNYVHD